MNPLQVWTRRLWPYAMLVALLSCVMLGVALARGRRTRPALSTAQQATVYAQSYVYRTDTLFRRDTTILHAATVRYRTIRDTLHLTDTGAVRIALVAADTVVSRADVALQSAAERIRAGDTLAVRLRAELALATRPPPRITSRAIALYDPITQTPAAAVESSLRVVGPLSIGVRGEQRFSIGEHPRLYVSASLAF